MSKPLPSPRESIRILREAECSGYVIKHCKAVAKNAVKITKKCMKNGINVDVQLVYVGALLHDIGRSKTHDVHHAVVGAEIARSIGLPERIVAIIERHVGGGITQEEATKLGWPKGVYMPETIEEKIVTYADKLVVGTKTAPIEEALRRLKDELGENHPAIERVRSLHNEVSALCGPQRLKKLKT